MRIRTMLAVALVAGLGAVGTWVLLGSDGLSLFTGDHPVLEKAARKRVQRRSAPYVVLVPAKTLPEPEKVAAATPDPPATMTPAPAQPVKPKQPEPERKAPGAPVAPAQPATRATAPVARETLEALNVSKPVSTPADKPAPQIGREVRPEGAPAPKPAPVPVPVPRRVVRAEPERAASPEPAPQAPAGKSQAAAPKPKPLARAKPEPVAVPQTSAAVPPKRPAPSEPAVAAKRPQLQLKYETETDRQAEARKKKQQSLPREGTVRLSHVIPVGTGHLTTNTGIVRLAGVDALSSDAECKYASGEAWSCGRWGTFALRRLIRGRSVVCDMSNGSSENEVAGRCKVAGVDINKWVVRRGWAVPTADTAETYAAALEAAKKDKLGQWSEGPAATP